MFFAKEILTVVYFAHAQPDFAQSADKSFLSPQIEIAKDPNVQQLCCCDAWGLCELAATEDRCSDFGGFMRCSKFFTSLVFVKLSVCVLLALLTFLFFYFSPSLGRDQAVLLVLCAWVLKFLWVVAVVWFVWPLLAFWRGRLLVLLGCIFLGLMLLPMVINSQLVSFIGHTLRLTALPDAWFNAQILFVAGHFLVFLVLSVFAFSLYFSRFVNVFVGYQLKTGQVRRLGCRLFGNPTFSICLRMLG